MIKFYKNSNGLEISEKWSSNAWISVVNPTAQEKDYLIKTLHIPEDFYNDIEDIDERPRIEIEEGWTLIVIRIPLISDEDKLPFSTMPLGIIFKDDVILTLSFKESDVLQDFIVYQNKKKLEIKDHYDLVLKLLVSSKIWYLKYLKQLSQMINKAEDNLEQSVRNEELHKLIQIEKCLVFFMTSLKGNDVLLHRVKNIKTERDNFDPELLEDAVIELRQAQEMTGIYSNILAGMMDAYASVIANNMNEIMKQLTSISIILMIPTVIASFYGMNVINYLEDNPYGMAILVGISVVLSVVGVLLFRRRRFF